MMVNFAYDMVGILSSVILCDYCVISKTKFRYVSIFH
jgi:hypothetical protein